MGILLCAQNFRDVWSRNESVRAEIGQILHTDTHAAKLAVRIRMQLIHCCLNLCCQDNGSWDFAQDEQIMLWATQRPEDWQLGGKCDAYMWGGGRHGQMCESGRSSLIPTATSSFTSAQQVQPLIVI